mmetsp:Transcript_50953/g.119487  ORF Transcript_50953/g.119487 Transcript_50953/m.119487 type:complete len:263 (+) Transcript_50953:320-1108(+)
MAGRILSASSMARSRKICLPDKECAPSKPPRARTTTSKTDISRSAVSKSRSLSTKANPSSNSLLRPMSHNVVRESMMVMPMFPNVSFPSSEIGFSSSDPHALRLYPDQACRKASRTSSAKSFHLSVVPLLDEPRGMEMEPGGSAKWSCTADCLLPSTLEPPHGSTHTEMLPGEVPRTRTTASPRELEWNRPPGLRISSRLSPERRWKLPQFVPPSEGMPRTTSSTTSVGHRDPGALLPSRRGCSERLWLAEVNARARTPRFS